MVEIIKTIMKELKASGKTLILVEHNMDIIRELSDDIIVLDEGKLIAEGKPDEVLNNKKVLEAYLGE
jgi:ABC-type branched-subunit amino acid transport system ATPase component